MAYWRRNGRANSMIKRNEGFTIIEALCAFAILAIGLTGLYAAAGPIIGGMNRVANMQLALLFAESKLDEIGASVAALPPETHGRLENSNIAWTVTTEDLSSQRDRLRHLSLQEVRLTLSWPAGITERSLSFDTRHLGSTAP